MYALKFLRARICVLIGTKIQEDSALCDVRLVNQTNGFSDPLSSHKQNRETLFILKIKASLTVHRDDIPPNLLLLMPPSLWSRNPTLFFLLVFLTVLGD